MIYSNQSARLLLGCILLKPQLLNNDKYILTKQDFAPSEFHMTLFQCCQWLAKHGSQKVDAVDIQSIVESHEKQREILQENKYIEFCDTIKKVANIDSIDIYYENVRKNTLIRNLHSQGFDVSKFYDINMDSSHLDGYTIKDILNYYDASLIKMRQQFSEADDDTQEKQAGENGEQILESFATNPVMGLSFESKLLTTLWGGFRKQQLYMRSGDTSSGKSRGLIGDMCCVSCAELYDTEKKQWIKNPNGKHKSLYIGTEMALDEEVEPLLWAYVAAVDSSKITNNNMSPEELNRVKKAIQIVNDDCLWIVDMPSFNQYKIEERIKEHKFEHGLDFVVFDYMALSSALVREFVQNRGVGVATREDVVLTEFSKFMKDIAKKYDIGILTASQTNADISDYRIRDYRVLRGGKAMADKVTGGSISMPASKEEIELIKPILQRSKFQSYDDIFVETVYKSRFSEYPKECKIISQYNLGTMRKQEICVCYKDFRPITNIPKTIVQNA